MKRVRRSPEERREVLAFASEHGPRAAAKEFNIPVGTIYNWRTPKKAKKTSKTKHMLKLVGNGGDFSEARAQEISHVQMVGILSRATQITEEKLDKMKSGATLEDLFGEA